MVPLSLMTFHDQGAPCWGYTVVVNFTARHNVTQITLPSLKDTGCWRWFCAGCKCRSSVTSLCWTDTASVVTELTTVPLIVTSWSINSHNHTTLLFNQLIYEWLVGPHSPQRSLGKPLGIPGEFFYRPECLFLMTNQSIKSIQTAILPNSCWP